MSDDVIEVPESLDQDALGPGDRTTIGSDLLSFDPPVRVRIIDVLMEEHREALSALASIRDDAVRELAEESSVVDAAKTLGVSRQAVYRILQEQRQKGGSRFTNTVFLDERIDLDGRAFIGCAFQRCTLVFSGTAPFTLVGSALSECEWSFEGPAFLTLDFLRALHRNGDDGSREVVRQVIEGLTAEDVSKAD